MRRAAITLGLALLLPALPANAEIVKGVMKIKGAEMSWWGGMARDAIARQYDVDKNQVTLVCETDKGGYRPGTVTFFPKKGRSLDLRTMMESLTATRLSGGTAMSVDWLELTATGKVKLDAETVRLEVSGTKQQFVLGEASTKDGTKTPLQQLREAVAAGAKVASVTGRVDGWSGGFPAVLRALGQRPPDAPVVLFVTAFETSKNEQP